MQRGAEVWYHHHHQQCSSSVLLLPWTIEARSRCFRWMRVEARTSGTRFTVRLTGKEQLTLKKMSCVWSPGAHVLATACLMFCLTVCVAQKVSWQLGADILSRALTSPNPAAVARSTRPARNPQRCAELRSEVSLFYLQTVASRQTKCSTSTPQMCVLLFWKCSSLQWIRRTRGASLRASDSFDHQCNNLFGHVTRRENPVLRLLRESSKWSHVIWETFCL